MVTEFTFAGLTFHTYGILIGVAIILTLKIAEQNIANIKEKKDFFWDASVFLLLGSIVGARVWHVITDWSLYKDSPIEALYLWQGGLSIVGALLGLFFTAFLITKRPTSKLTFFEVSDAIAIGLPFGQALGRLGNWVNQELYGLPTDLPWKLYIDENNRLAGYEHLGFYHPLFAYEAISLVIIGAGLWFKAKSTTFRVGSGIITLLYLAAYGWIRFFLEFLRIDKAVFTSTFFGVNQVIMLLVAVGATMYLIRKSYAKT